MPDNAPKRKTPGRDAKVVGAIRLLQVSYTRALNGFAEEIRAPLCIEKGEKWPADECLGAREQLRDEIRQRQADLVGLMRDLPDVCWVNAKAPCFCNEVGPDGKPTALRIFALWDRDELQRGYQALGKLLVQVRAGKPGRNNGRGSSGGLKEPGTRRTQPRTELTAKQQFVYELRRARLSFPKIAEATGKDKGADTVFAKPIGAEAARRLYERAQEVKARKGASVQTRRPLAQERRGDGD